jgi:integrase
MTTTPATIAAAASLGRYGARDAVMILVAYRHGLRVADLVGLRRDQVDQAAGLLQVRRKKRGTPSTHPLTGQEIRVLRKLLREGNPGYPIRAAGETVPGVSDRGRESSRRMFKILCEDPRATKTLTMSGKLPYNWDVKERSHDAEGTEPQRAH